eukprot:gene20630-22663_t
MEFVEDTILRINGIDNNEMDTFDVSHICSDESQAVFKEKIKDLEIQLAESKRDADKYLNYCGLIKRFAKDKKLEHMSNREIRNYSRSCDRLIRTLKDERWQYEQLKIYAANQQTEIYNLQYNMQEAETYLNKIGQDDLLIGEMLQNACHIVFNMGMKFGILGQPCSEEELDGTMNMAHTLLCASARIHREIEQGGVNWQTQQIQSTDTLLVNATEQQQETDSSLSAVTEKQQEPDSLLVHAIELEQETDSSWPADIEQKTTAVKSKRKTHLIAKLKRRLNALKIQKKADNDEKQALKKLCAVLMDKEAQAMKIIENLKVESTKNEKKIQMLSDEVERNAEQNNLLLQKIEQLELDKINEIEKKKILEKTLKDKENEIESLNATMEGQAVDIARLQSDAEKRRTKKSAFFRRLLCCCKRQDNSDEV